MTILVTGASGHVGSGVLNALTAAGANVRAVSRSPRPGQFPDGVDVVRADLDDPQTYSAALDGVQKVFLYASPLTAGDFAAAARRAGVEHIVVLSSIGVVSPHPENNPIARTHQAVEDAIIESGVDWTFVRPGYFATNMLRWEDIRTLRELRTAFPDATSSPVHERDIAGVAALSLLEDAQRGRAHAVLGAGPSTVREQVAAISRAIGEPVRLVSIDVDAYRQQLSASLPVFAVDHLIQAAGNIPVPPPDAAIDSVRELLGRAPLSFEEWAKDHADQFR